MMMMMTNLEYIATEDLATAKSSVAISSAHRDDNDEDHDENNDDVVGWHDIDDDMNIQL